MRFAILHCRNPLCSRHVWVPKTKLGYRGKCPECGHAMGTPAAVPEDQLVEGPPIMEDFNLEERKLEVARS